MRLTLHTAAYWLILTMHDAIPAAHALATADVATVRLRLSKLATRVIETASRVRLPSPRRVRRRRSSATSRRL
jgi:Transposase DDE domain group 1